MSDVNLFTGEGTSLADEPASQAPDTVEINGQQMTPIGKIPASKVQGINTDNMVPIGKIKPEEIDPVALAKDDPDGAVKSYRTRNPEGITWGDVITAGPKLMYGVAKGAITSIPPLIKGGAAFLQMPVETFLPGVDTSQYPQDVQDKIKKADAEMTGAWLDTRESLKNQYEGLKFNKSKMLGLLSNLTGGRVGEKLSDNDIKSFLLAQAHQQDIAGKVQAGDVKGALDQMADEGGTWFAGKDKLKQQAAEAPSKEELQKVGYSGEEAANIGQAGELALWSTLPLGKVIPRAIAEPLASSGLMAGSKVLKGTASIFDNPIMRRGMHYSPVYATFSAVTGHPHGIAALGLYAARPIGRALGGASELLGEAAMGPEEAGALNMTRQLGGAPASLARRATVSGLRAGAEGAVHISPFALSAQSPEEVGETLGTGAMFGIAGLGARQAMLDAAFRLKGGAPLNLSTTPFEYGHPDDVHHAEATADFPQDLKDDINRTRHGYQGLGGLFVLPENVFNSRFQEGAMGVHNGNIYLNGELGARMALAHEPMHGILQAMPESARQEIFDSLLKYNNPSEFATKYFSDLYNEPTPIDFDALPDKTAGAGVDPSNPYRITKQMVLEEMAVDAMRNKGFNDLTQNPDVIRWLQLGAGKMAEKLGLPMTDNETKGIWGINPSYRALSIMEQALRAKGVSAAKEGPTYGQPIVDPSVHYDVVKNALRSTGYNAGEAGDKADEAIEAARALGRTVSEEDLIKRALTGKFPAAPQPAARPAQAARPTVPPPVPPELFTPEQKARVNELVAQGYPEDIAFKMANDEFRNLQYRPRSAFDRFIRNRERELGMSMEEAHKMGYDSRGMFIGRNEPPREPIMAHDPKKGIYGWMDDNGKYIPNLRGSIHADTAVDALGLEPYDYWSEYKKGWRSMADVYHDAFAKGWIRLTKDDFPDGRALVAHYPTAYGDISPSKIRELTEMAKDNSYKAVVRDTEGEAGYTPIWLDPKFKEESQMYFMPRPERFRATDEERASALPFNMEPWEVRFKELLDREDQVGYEAMRPEEQQEINTLQREAEKKTGSFPRWYWDRFGASYMPAVHAGLYPQGKAPSQEMIDYYNRFPIRTGASGLWDSTFVDGEGEARRLDLAPLLGADPKKHYYEQKPDVRKKIRDYFMGRGEAQYMPKPKDPRAYIMRVPLHEHDLLGGDEPVLSPATRAMDRRARDIRNEPNQFLLPRGTGQTNVTFLNPKIVLADQYSSRGDDIPPYALKDAALDAMTEGHDGLVVLDRRALEPPNADKEGLGGLTSVIYHDDPKVALDWASKNADIIDWENPKNIYIPLEQTKLSPEAAADEKTVTPPEPQEAFNKYLRGEPLTDADLEALGPDGPQDITPEERAGEWWKEEGGEPFQDLRFMPNPHPNAIKEAAVKTDDGKIFTGFIHAAAFEKARQAGYHIRQTEDGFVDNSGKFYNRAQAYVQADKMGQEPQRASYPAGGGYQLEAYRWYEDQIGNRQKAAENFDRWSSESYMPKRMNVDEWERSGKPGSLIISDTGNIYDTGLDMHRDAQLALSDAYPDERRVRAIVNNRDKTLDIEPYPSFGEMSDKDWKNFNDLAIEMGLEKARDVTKTDWSRQSRIMRARSYQYMPKSVTETAPKDDAETARILREPQRAKVGAHRDLPEGTPIGVRIDIPAYNAHGKYVQSIHEPRGNQVGPVIGYDSLVNLEGPISFQSNEAGAEKIYTGENRKFPVATVRGQFNPSRDVPNVSDWTPVGFNPKTHSYFYDKNSMLPVKGGDRALSVGNTVFVENPEYGRPEDYLYMPPPREVSPEELQALKDMGRNMLESMRSGTGRSLEGMMRDWNNVLNRAYASVQHPWGGMTINPETGRDIRLATSSGIRREGPFALSVKNPDQHTIEIPINAPQTVFNKAMADAVKAFPQLTGRDHYLGVFRDEDKGTIDFDPVAIVDTKLQAEALGAYTNAIGGAYDYATGDGVPPPIATHPLYMARYGPIEQAKQYLKDKGIKLTNVEEEFFGKIWAKALRHTGLQVSPDKPENFRIAAERAVADIRQFAKDNPHFGTYYDTDLNTAGNIIGKGMGKELSSEEFDVFRTLNGLFSNQTGLQRNTFESIAGTMLFRKNGNIDGFNTFVNPKTGNHKVAPGNPFTVSAQTAPTKIRSLNVFNDLIKSKGGVRQAIDFLKEAIPESEFRDYKQSLGYNMPDAKAMEPIKHTVRLATGQDKLIPRMFAFGKKVGAYTLNNLGDHRYNTVDVWESRFIKSYFKNMLEKNTGIMTSADEHAVMENFVKHFREAYREEIGEADNSSLQAIRWFYIIKASTEGGYQRGLSNDTISQYAENYFKRYGNTVIP